MTEKRTHHRLTALGGLGVAALLGACGGGGGDGESIVATPPPDTCAIAEQNRFVNDTMRDIYFWVDELPSVDPNNFDSPEALLDALRFEPLDRFSGIGDEAADDAFFSDSQFIGVGIGLFTSPEDRLFITQAFGDGPAAAAGLARGDEILTINGQTIAAVLAGDGISAAFGANEIGVPVDLTYRTLAGDELAASFTKDLVTIEPVPAVTTLDVDGRAVGYLAFRDFVNPAFDALADGFALIQAAGIDEMVLDLRYNGGGLLSVAEFLGNLLGGTTTAGQTFYTLSHNAQNSAFNNTFIFQDELNALDLNRLFVITSGSTASASELVLNALEPYMDVVLIGKTTSGKPVGQYGFTFCGKILRPVSFEIVNALGEGDYFDGIPPDCIADDDLTRALGDPNELALAEVINYIRTGMCSVPVAQAKAQLEFEAAKARSRVDRPSERGDVY